MKKAIVAVLMVLAGSLVFADRVVPASQLPAAAKSFISQYFPGKNATYVEADFNEYEVSLNDGTEIQFTGNGDWQEVKSYTGVPQALIPQTARSYLSSNFPGAVAIQIEKQWNGYKVELANRMEVYFDTNGNMLGQKYDD